MKYCSKCEWYVDDGGSCKYCGFNESDKKPPGPPSGNGTTQCEFCGSLGVSGKICDPCLQKGRRTVRR